MQPTAPELPLAGAVIVPRHDPISAGAGSDSCSDSDTDRDDPQLAGAFGELTQSTHEEHVRHLLSAACWSLELTCLPGRVTEVRTSGSKQRVYQRISGSKHHMSGWGVSIASSGSFPFIYIPVVKSKVLESMSQRPQRCSIVSAAFLDRARRKRYGYLTHHRHPHRALAAGTLTPLVPSTSHES